MTVRERLRAATSEVHEALHGAAPFARIAEGNMTVADYGALVRMLHRYHTLMAPACEAGAAALAEPVLAAAHAARIAALEQDLAFLDVAPQPTDSEPCRDEGFAIGCLYTVQGSTLGGKVIFRQLDMLLPAGDGRRFFEGTAQDGAQWRLLCQALERQDSLTEMIEGARHAFRRFEDLISESPARQPRSPAPGARPLQSA